MKHLWKILAAGAMLFTGAAPLTANAQSLKDLEKIAQRRQDKKNEWRNIAIGAGAVAVLGLFKKDSTLTFAGTAGALYSLYRYEQDRKSQNSLNRARAAYFSKPYFYRDGQKYTRKLVTKNGKKYYQFVRSK